jgi:hypothetical protein
MIAFYTNLFYFLSFSTIILPFMQYSHFWFICGDSTITVKFLYSFLFFYELLLLFYNVDIVDFVQMQ